MRPHFSFFKVSITFVVIWATILNALRKFLPDVLTSATESSQRSYKIKIINKFKLIHQHYFNNILNDKTKSGEEGRFTVYSKIKRYFIYEKYLSMDNNILRRHITSIRISTHSLPVELLRKSGVKREDRKCTLCASNKIATEYHALDRKSTRLNSSH